MTTELCILAEKYRVDKCPAIYHSYTPKYNAILQPIRHSARVIVEIGIGYTELMIGCGADYRPGASLRMWRDYFPSAQIIGCDIRRDTFFSESRIECMYVDQSNGDSLNNLSAQLQSYAQPDLILDDGSHEFDHMILSFQKLWPLVKPGGFYIIEDISEPFQHFLDLPVIYGARDCVVHSHHISETTGQKFVCYLKIQQDAPTQDPTL